MIGIPREYKILSVISIVAIIVGVLLFIFGNKAPQAGNLVVRTNAYSQGNMQARIVVTEFADFQCPACKTVQPTIKKIQSEYPQDVRFVFRHLPLSGHPLANISAEAAEAAGTQGKFWEMHDLLYAKQDEWGSLSKSMSEQEAIAKFIQYAKGLGLDDARFSSDLKTSAYNSIISDDTNAAMAAGVNATPTFFVNGTMLDAPSYDALKKAIDAALTSK